MYELEDYSSSIHDGFISKYTDLGNSLDLFISDSMQEILDIDIRSEIANVVGGSNEFASLLTDLPSSFDQAIEALSAINNTSGSGGHSAALHNGGSSDGVGSSGSSGGVGSNGDGLSGSYSGPISSWMGSNPGPSWSSSSNDFYADVGACVNPISVMPLISSSLVRQSPKATLNSSSIRSSSVSVSGRHNLSPPNSPNPNETKSHLTFSPAQVKISAGSIRHEQILSHIPKQIVTISSAVTAGTTAPATLATNSVLQRKNVMAVDAIKKDLGLEMRKSQGSPASAISTDELKSSTGHSSNVSNGILTTNGFLHGTGPSSGASTTNTTIKLGPGIGGLTFANSITYNKLKQQSSAKSPQCSPVTANGTIVLKRDRGSSPLTTLNVNGMAIGGGGSKLLGRNIAQTVTNFTPKSIASANSPLMHSGSGSVSSAGASPSSVSMNSGGSSPSTHTGSVSGGFTTTLTPISVGRVSSPGSSMITSVAVKPLQQKIKPAPVESEFPKPAYSYSCLIAMALKNSRGGSLPVSEIYSFMCEHFPYFKTAPSGWKNSVRHNLSLNKCFEKIEKPATNGSQRKGCLWAMNPDRIIKMDEEVQKWSRKDPMAIRNAMVFPEHLEALERGEMKHGSSGDSDVELDSQSEIEETSDLEEQELDETIVENMFVEEEIEEDDVVTMNGHDDAIGMEEYGGDTSTGADGDGGCVVGVGGHTIEQQHQRDFDLEVSLETHMIEKASMLYEKVEDIYDEIEFEDNKEALQMALNQSSDIIELSPSDINGLQYSDADGLVEQSNSSSGSGYQSPKRARLNINYSIGPAGELEKQLHQQNIKQIKVPAQTLQQLHQLQQAHNQHHLSQHHQQHAQPQHIVVQTITNGNGGGGGGGSGMSQSGVMSPATTTVTLTAQQLSHHRSTASSSSSSSPIQFQQITAIPTHNRRKMQLVNRIA